MSTASYTTLTVTSCRSEPCVPSGLNFKATAWWFRCTFFVSNYSVLRVAVKMTWRSFVVKCGNSRKSAHPPLWQTCKVLRPWALFRETTVLVFQAVSWNSNCPTNFWLFRSCSRCLYHNIKMLWKRIGVYYVRQLYYKWFLAQQYPDPSTKFSRFYT